MVNMHCYKNNRMLKRHTDLFLCLGNDSNLLPYGASSSVAHQHINSPSCVQFEHL